MAIELVTGKKGTVHVDSADDGALYAAIAGKGEYVLDLDDRLACTMTTANKAHVASGHGLMQGRHWLIDAEGVDLTIQNGTQGQKRNDLIVARYECDAKNGNIESVALKVIKGTPTTGTPADPACTRGDILEGAALVNEQPLWRIPLNGITVGTPIQMFDVLTPAKKRGIRYPASAEWSRRPARGRTSDRRSAKRAATWSWSSTSQRRQASPQATRWRRYRPASARRMSSTSRLRRLQPIRTPCPRGWPSCLTAGWPSRTTCPEAGWRTSLRRYAATAFSTA